MQRKEGLGLKKLKLFLAAILVVACTYGYDLSRWENTSGDTISSRYWPVSILKHQTYKLNPFRDDLKGVDYSAIYFGNGDWIPRVTWGMALVTVPFYAVVDWFDVGGKEWTHDRISYASRWNAVFMAVVTVVALFYLLCRFATPGISFVSSLLFAFGGWHWSLGAQGLTSQGAAVLVHVLNMWLLWIIATTPKKKRVPDRQIMALAALHAVLWSIRPNDVFLVMPAVLLLRSQRGLFLYGVSLAATLGPLLYLYKVIYKNILGFYGLLSALSFGGKSAAFWQHNPFEGFFGILFSPNRGAIVFFPLFLLVPFLWSWVMPTFRIRDTLSDLLHLRLPKWEPKPVNGIPDGYAQYLGWSVLLYFTSVFTLEFWHSTWSYGPRYLYEIQPYLWPVFTLALAELWKKLKGMPATVPAWALGIFLIFNIQGVAVHWLGHENYDLWVWNGRGGNVDNRKAWRFSDFMLTEVWKVGSNKERWPDALGRLKKYGF